MNHFLDCLTTHERVTCPDCGVDRFKVLEVLDKSTGITHEIVMRAKCRCQAERLEAEEKARQAAYKQEFVRRARIEGIPDQHLHSYTFSKDEAPDSDASITCRQYVAQWKAMQKSRFGVLLFGGIGTGKTYYAACIANALINMGNRVSMSTIAKLMASVSFEDRDEALSEMNRADLLVIDDLGAERHTEYALELIYAIIDTRVKSGRPMVITTNATPADMQAERDISLARIYDRILEACPIRIEVTGKSRRALGDTARVAEAQRMLFSRD